MQCRGHGNIVALSDIGLRVPLEIDVWTTATFDNNLSSFPKYLKESCW